MAIESNRLEGRTALVTGTATGLGRGMAYKLARNGAAVICADINDQGNKLTVDNILSEGGKAFAVHMDVGSSASVNAAVAEAVKLAGDRIDILINNAGIVLLGKLNEVTDESWDRIIKINLTGCFYVLRAVYPYMKAHGGNIVQISSTSAKSGGIDYHPAYTTSKGGILSLSRHAAKAWAKDGIRVNTICPYFCETTFKAPDQPQEQMDEWRVAVAKRIPLGRISTPEDLAGVMMFLVTDESSFVTGISVDVTGGGYIFNN